MRNSAAGQRRSRIPGWVHVSAASVLVTSPFLGTAFQGDQKPWMYIVMNETAGNPWAVVSRSVRHIDFFLSAGNFRPLGRMLIDLEHVFYLTTGITTGVPPHIIHGFVRLAMVAILAVTANRFVVSLERSAMLGISNTSGDTPVEAPSFATALFPMVFAMTLVVIGLHPFVYFPFWSISVVSISLAVPLIVASDNAISRKWSWHNGHALRSGAFGLGIVVVLGAALAMTYDLLYLVPTLCLVLIVTRGVLARIGWRDLICSVASARFVALIVGFIVVFVPTRLVIASRCTIERCSPTSDVDFAGLSPGIVLNRMLTGLPAAGWYRAKGGTIAADLSLTGIIDQSFRGLTPLAVVLLLMIAFVVYKRTVRNIGDDKAVQMRLGTALIPVGLAFISLPALMVSLAPKIQNTSLSYSIGAPWRDTLMVQVGWSLVILGVLLIIISRGWSSLGSRFNCIAIAVYFCLIYTILVTYHANQTYSQRLHSRSTDIVHNFISTAFVNFDTSEHSTKARCEILELFETPNHLSIVPYLNELADSLYGHTFCSQHKLANFTGVFADDDGSPYENEIEILAAANITAGCSIRLPEPSKMRFFCPEGRVTGETMLIFLKRMEFLGLIEEGNVDTFIKQNAMVLNDILTRGDVTLLLLDITSELTPIPNPDELFTDIDDRHLAGYAEAFYHAGISEGCTADPPQYCPDDPITRAEIASFLVRTLGLTGS